MAKIDIYQVWQKDGYTLVVPADPLFFTDRLVRNQKIFRRRETLDIIFVPFGILCSRMKLSLINIFYIVTFSFIMEGTDMAGFTVLFTGYSPWFL